MMRVLYGRTRAEVMIDDALEAVMTLATANGLYPQRTLSINGVELGIRSPRIYKANSRSIVIHENLLE